MGLCALGFTASGVWGVPEDPGTLMLRDSLFHLLGRSWLEASAQKDLLYMVIYYLEDHGT